MFGLGPATKIYIAVEFVDMRKGFDGLYGLVRDRLGEDPLSGHLFLFINRTHGDGDGGGREWDDDAVSDGVRELHGEFGEGDGSGGEMEDPADGRAGESGAGDRAESGGRSGLDY